MKRMLATVVLAVVGGGVMADQDEIISEIQNTSFESPSILDGATLGDRADKWFWFASTNTTMLGVSDGAKRTGMQSLGFACQVPVDATQGVAQKFKALPGCTYTVTAHVMNDPQEPLVNNAYGQISLEWQDLNGREVGRMLGETWHEKTTPGKWTQIGVEAAAPNRAAIGVVVITVFSRNAEGIGRCFVDDCELKMSAGN